MMEKSKITVSGFFRQALIISIGSVLLISMLYDESFSTKETVIQVFICIVFAALFFMWFISSFETARLSEFDIIVGSLLLYCCAYIFRLKCFPEILCLGVLFLALLLLNHRAGNRRNIAVMILLIVFDVLGGIGFISGRTENGDSTYFKFGNYYYVFFIIAEVLLLSLYVYICAAYKRSSVLSKNFSRLLITFLFPIAFLILNRQPGIDLPRTVLIQCIGWAVFGNQLLSNCCKKAAESLERFLKRKSFFVIVVALLTVSILIDLY